MKIKVLQEKINQALSQAEKITSKDITLPILGNVMVKAEKNNLFITATNLETGAKWKLLSKTEEDGEVVLPAQTFSSLIGSFPAGSMDIDSNNGSITVVSNHRKSIIKGFSAEEFPTLPVNNEGEYFSIRADLFCKALMQVVGFTGNSSVKPEITGVYLTIKNNVIKLVATDSFRLGEKRVDVLKNTTISREYSIIIPPRAVREIIMLFADTQQILNVFLNPNQITVNMESIEAGQTEIQFISRLIEGEFPDYQAIIPTTFVVNAAFSKKELLNHLKSAGLFSGKSGEVIIKTDKKKSSLVVSSKSAELGEFESEVKLDSIEGDDVEAVFNYRFLVDGLMAIKDDKCLFEFSKDDGPGVLKSSDDASFIYILMPIKKF